ncbi:DUF1593 domain-containing protein [Synoicihabitans lomoniglobus]|uniref:DUF1593 domain-containing protein n=1 Tax=Synoicihabitans lomoniglobus TaxID=2909285 RepID=A0AAF0CQ26_9BACT|nr:DUF1593 domain-containing protein [Opitutaceae bacterium LMO-M01]WED65965.1 DUF1593 domain-containing protein [Opitutaceae bacterium LMO-M01]
MIRRLRFFFLPFLGRDFAPRRHPPCAGWLSGLLLVATVAVTSAGKPRVVVTTDGEVDDMNSLIRMLHYANEFEWEGIVITSSIWHYAGDGKGTLFTSEDPEQVERYGERTDLRWTGVEWVDDIIDLYAEVYPNLRLHAPGYPSPESLHELVKVGNITFEGEMAVDTEGSQWIEALLLDDEPGPLWLHAWGGANTIARALKAIEARHRGTSEWERIYRKVTEKAVLYMVADQDATYRNYIEPHWPDLPVLYNLNQHEPIGYGWWRINQPSRLAYLRGAWWREYVKLGHGALGGRTYLWGDGQQTAGDPLQQNGSLAETRQAGRDRYDFISEGDSVAILHQLPVGLRSEEDPTYGGWGGRLVRSDGEAVRWEATRAVTDLNTETGAADYAYPVSRWLPAFQNDYAARADWAVLPYDEANHPPVVTVEGPLDLTAKAGETITLTGTASDPDGDALDLRWWQYREAGTAPYPATLTVLGDGRVQIQVPVHAEPGQTLHFILEATDDGEPALTRYRRVIVTLN